MPTDRETWKFIQKEARALHGSESQWREGEVFISGMILTMNTYYFSKNNKSVHLL
jgi:hypothetical protein